MCIRDSVPPGLGVEHCDPQLAAAFATGLDQQSVGNPNMACLLYTSDAADERSSVDLGGRRIIKKKKNSRTLEDEAVARRTLGDRV